MEGKIVQCQHCGETKPIEEFRNYYNRPRGQYVFCLTCERINNRRKYLTRKTNRTAKEQEELDKIHLLYDLQIKAGLRAKTHKARPLTSTIVDEQMLKFV